MKVLQPGRSPEKWSREEVCTGKGNGGHGCSAKLAIEVDDLFRTCSHVHTETDWYVTFKCCECGRLNDVDGIPDELVRRLPLYAVWMATQRKAAARLVSPPPPAEPVTP